MQTATVRVEIVKRILLKRDNGNDHRAGTINLNIEKHTQVRIRVHRIVIPGFAVLVKVTKGITKSVAVHIGKQ